VDAAYKAINAIMGVPNELTEFAIKAVTEGIDAQGEVTVRIRHEDKTYMGRGADTDIVVASAKALINALNRVLAVQRPADTEVRTSP
jgi:2-isopropylmalate synthase